MSGKQVETPCSEGCNQWCKVQEVAGVSGVPPSGGDAEPVLLNVFISGLGTSCSAPISMSAGETKLMQAACTMLEGRAALLGDRDGPRSWADSKLQWFNKGKHKSWLLGRVSLCHTQHRQGTGGYTAALGVPVGLGSPFQPELLCSELPLWMFLL